MVVRFSTSYPKALKRLTPFPITLIVELSVASELPIFAISFAKEAIVLSTIACFC